LPIAISSFRQPADCYFRLIKACTQSNRTETREKNESLLVTFIEVGIVADITSLHPHLGSSCRSPQTGGWAYTLKRGDQLNEKWNKIPGDGIDILMTRSPPAGMQVFLVMTSAVNWQPARKILA